MYTKCELFTENEDLWDRISLERGIEIINKEDVVVYSCELSRNYYGEFLFLTIKYEDDIINMWGLGEHSYREKWIDYFNIDRGDGREITGKVPLDIAIIMNQIIERKELGKSYTLKQSRKGELYELLADIGDEDGAASMMDDYEDSLERRLLEEDYDE